MPPTTSKRTVAFVSAATAFSLLGDQVLYAVLPVMHESLGLSAIQVGLLLSANRWIRLVTNELAHRFSERHANGWFFAAALTVGAATTLAYVATHSFTLLLVARLTWGLSWSFIRHLGVGAVMAQAPAERAGHTMGVYNGISRAGSVVGLFGGAVLVDLLGFHLGMVTLATISLLAIPLALWGFPDTKATTSIRLSTSTQPILPQLLALGVVLGAVGPRFVMSTLGATLLGYVGEQALFTAASATGALLALRYVIDSAMAPWLGGAVDRFGFRRANRFYLILGGVALVLASFRPSLWLFVALIMLFFNCATGLQAGVAGRVSQLGSQAYARYVTASDLGSALGPLLGWLVIDQLGNPTIALGIAGALFLAATLVVPQALLRA